MHRILLFITVARRHRRSGRDAVSRHRHQWHTFSLQLQRCTYQIYAYVTICDGRRHLLPRRILTAYTQSIYFTFYDVTENENKKD